ncbi:MAG: hypothetical protein ABIT37_11710 [Luteolibacter sp.]
MIRRYNFSQKLLAALALAGSVICYLLTWLFFRHVPALATHQFGFPMTPGTANLVAVLGMAATTWSAYRTWRAGGGLKGYHESALYHDLGEESAGAFVVDFYAHRITGPAHALSQIFLAGPLLLFRAGTLAASHIPFSRGLEDKLAETLEILRGTNKWQPITDYPDNTEEILFLSQMKLIDFSAAKGVPRIKADRKKPS